MKHFSDLERSESRGRTTSKSLGHVRSDLALGESSAVSTVTAFLENIERQPEVNAFVTVTKDSAIESAKKSQERIDQGNPLPLDGIPIAVKDNYCTRGVKTTAGSKILGDFVPEYESFVTQRLLDAGAVIVGKTNLDEFAMGSSTASSHFGPTKNPIGIALGNSNLAPGGSSGGSAAAVAAGMALGALGTDTGGSIRQPAAFCGVVGFKPTYGICSRWGIVAYGSSLDQAGVFARDVQGCGAIMDVISGHDPQDSTSLLDENMEFEAAAKSAKPCTRIGVPKEVIEFDSTKDADLVWERARKAAEQLGAEVVEISIPHFKYALPAYYVIALSEASSNLARYDGVRYGFRAENCESIEEMYEETRAQGFGAEVKRRVMLGTFALSAGHYDAYYLRALKVRRLLSEEFTTAFKEVDLLMMPTTPTAAFEVGAHGGSPVEMYLEDIFTVPVNLAGLPAISIPIGNNSKGLPLGLQLIGPQLGDEDVISTAAAFEAIQ